VTSTTNARHRAAVIAIARAVLAGDEDALHAAVERAVALVPVRDCDACGTPYLHVDRRRRRFCSARCRFRIAQRERRRRAKGEPEPTEAAA